MQINPVYRPDETIFYFVIYLTAYTAIVRGFFFKGITVPILFFACQRKLYLYSTILEVFNRMSALMSIHLTRLLLLCNWLQASSWTTQNGHLIFPKYFGCPFLEQCITSAKEKDAIHQHTKTVSNNKGNINAPHYWVVFEWNLQLTVGLCKGPVIRKSLPCYGVIIGCIWFRGGLF